MLKFFLQIFAQGSAYKNENVVNTKIILKIDLNLVKEEKACLVGRNFSKILGGEKQNVKLEFGFKLFPFSKLKKETCFPFFLCSPNGAPVFPL